MTKCCANACPEGEEESGRVSNTNRIDIPHRYDRYSGGLNQQEPAGNNVSMNVMFSRKATQNQEELSQQERREERLNVPKNFGRPVNPILNREGRLCPDTNNHPVSSAPAVFELEQPRSSWGENHERREERLNVPKNFGRPVNPILNRGGRLCPDTNNHPVPSAPAVLELEQPRSSWGEIHYLPHSHMQTGEPTGDNIEKKTKNQEELKTPVPSAPAALEIEKPKSSQGGQTCCVCMNQDVEIIFNCGHAATCAECSQSLCACPICRSDITSRNRIYLSGI